MQVRKKNTFRIRFLAGLCAVALSWGFTLPQAKAQENPREPAAGAAPITLNQKVSSGKRYFVEFRSRSALSYGHTFLVHGKLNANGQIGRVTAAQVAGLHPATESTVPWMIGHLIPVVSETGASDGDTEDEYTTAAYKITLTEQEYARVSAYIRNHQKNSPLWHAVLYNCNAWVGDVAKFMGLKAPSKTMSYPEEYITAMAAMNGGKATRPNPLPQRSAAASRPAKPQAAKPQTPKPQTVATPAATPAAEPEATIR